MKVAIFETDHHEVAYPVICAFDNGQNEITVFIYSDAALPLKTLLGEKANKINWRIKEKSETKISFIHRIYKQVKKEKISLLYFDTISDNFIFYSLTILFLKKTRTIVTIHAINNFFDHRFSFSLRRIIRTIGKKILIKVTREFNVIHAPLVPYLNSKIPANKKVHCLPGALYESPELSKYSSNTLKTIKIVIPGSVDERRRNYFEAFELAHYLKRKNIPHSITFLGRLVGNYGDKIRKKCIELNQTGFDFTYFSYSDVQQQEFDRIMSESSFVFMPMRRETIFEDGITETYGLSTATGGFSEVIRHAKPFIIPIGITTDPIFKESCCIYSSIEEVGIFISNALYQNSYYELLTKNARKASEYFTIEKIRDRNPDLFKKN